METSDLLSTPKARELKVCGKYFARNYAQGVILPEIRLAGRWLENLGFVIGNKVRIECVDRKLIITLTEVQPPAIDERKAATDKRTLRRKLQIYDNVGRQPSPAIMETLAHEPNHDTLLKPYDKK